MWLPVLLLALLVGTSHAARNVTVDVQAFVAKFQELNQTKDVVESLDTLGTTCKELFKIGRPAAELLQTFNSTGNATEDEVSALTELNKMFTSVRGELLAGEHSRVEALEYYDEPSPLLTATLALVSSLDILTNTSTRAQHGLRHYAWLTSRADAYDPLRAIDTIDFHTRIGCRNLPTTKGIKMIVELQEAFRRLEQRVEPSLSAEEMAYWREDPSKNIHLMSVASHENEKNIANLTRAIDNINTTSVDQVLLELEELLVGDITRGAATNGQCMLAHATNGLSFNQTALYNTLRTVHSDLLRAELFAWAIAAIRETDKEPYFTDMEVASILLNRTGKFVAKWTRHVQNVTWPEIGVEFAKREIDNTPNAHDALNETARRIQKAFEEHGSPSYAYHVVVVPSGHVVYYSDGEDGGRWTHEDHTRIGVVVAPFKSIDAYVFRSNRTGAAQRLAEAKKRIEEKREPLFEAIKHGKLADDLLSLINNEGSTPCTTIHTAYYKSAILLKMKQISTENSTMPIGWAIDEQYLYQLELTTSWFRGKETTDTWKAISTFFL